MKEYPCVRHFDINCMSLSQATLPGLFDRLAELCGGPSAVRELRGHTGRSLALTSAKQIARLRTPVILVVDEIDQLVKRSRNVESVCALETLFSLPLVADMPEMAIIGIANAVNLLKATPVPRGLVTTLLFEPYTAPQLREIMTARLAASGHGMAAEKNLGRIGMEMPARQVAKHSGDCRRLITFCNQAISDVVIAEEMSSAAVGMNTECTKVSDDATPKKPSVQMPRSTQNDPLASISHLPIEQQMLLCTLAGSKAEAVRLSEICSGYKVLCRRLHQPMNLASKGCVASAISALEERGLLASRAGKQTGGGRSTPRGGLTPRGGGDQVVELAVSRDALRKSIARVNPLLERCMD
eukprot:TRINITY_DN2120_c0_g2_i1.p1 TRINITY_DN2120_c0_g2~~TRINITY_DN2120_c0_g2_i1.p1  ORF type:complete len:355 (-),score=55.85 TRINITY_DN2120_c0_g2_i1:545-1609(-)